VVDQASELRSLLKDSDDHTTKIFTVCSGKGGVGKSNLSTNLAIAFSDLGKKVLVIDSDQGFANVNILLGEYVKYTIQDVYRGKVELKDVIIETNGISLIPGGNDVINFDEEEIHPDEFKRQFERIGFYDIIIVDSSAGISHRVLSNVIFAHEIIVITTPEATALTDAYALLKNVDSLKLKSRAKIIVNRTMNHEEGFEVYSRLKAAVDKYLSIHLDYVGSVTDDRVVSKCVREGVPFYVAYPRSEASVDVRRLASVLLEIESKVIGSSVSDLFRKFQSIFKR
jgi:flagellar biosynthesis protein FlhG